MTSKITITAHKKAIENFNKKANELLKLVQPIDFPPSAQDDFKSERPVGSTITQEKIRGDVVFTNETTNGDLGVCFLILDNKPVGLSGDSIDKLNNLVSALAKVTCISQTAGDDSIEAAIFDWLRAKKRKSSRKWFWTYFKEALLSVIKSQQVYVAIDGVETEVSAQFGDVGLLPLRQICFDEWEGNCLDRSPNQTDDVKTLFQRMRQDMQGFAAVRISIVAEPKFAHEQAFAIAGRVCDGLRIYAPQRNSLDQRALYAPFGTSVRPESHTIVVGDNDDFSYQNSSLDSGGHYWRINEQYFRNMIDDKFHRVFEIAISGPSNEFQEHVWKSVCAFSKSLTPIDIHDRLAFRVSALESMFLKDSSEPIGVMVAERMAFLLSQTAKSRQQIVTNFRKIYKMRSDYVHHRKTRNELQDMEYFAQVAWSAMQTLLRNVDQFSTKNDFFEALEELRYGGSGG